MNKKINNYSIIDALIIIQGFIHIFSVNIMTIIQIFVYKHIINNQKNSALKRQLDILYLFLLLFFFIKA